jgi:hypothetical protein
MSALAEIPVCAWQIKGPTASHPESSPAARAPPSSVLSHLRRRLSRRRAQVNTPFPILEIKHT